MFGLLQLIVVVLCVTCSNFLNVRSMDAKKVVVVDNGIPKVAIDILSSNFNDVVVNQEKVTKENILKIIPGADGVLWNTHTPLDADILDAAGPQLKIVGSISAGVDQFDLNELKKRGIRLTNTSPALNDTVANIAVLLTLAASRRLHEGRLTIENGTWVGGYQWMLGQDISGSTVGIVGFGSIGQAIARKLSVFSVNRIVYSGHREKPEAKALNAELVSFDELLRISDFVIIACPLTDETRGMFNESAFAKMKSTAVLVNVARGGIINQPDLVEALKTNRIFAAGLDVTTPEPLPVDHELLKLHNVVLMPHLGSATIKTRNAMAELASNNIVRGLSGQELLSPVV